MPQRFVSNHRPSSPMPGHRHLSAYIALVETGSYLEYSVDGVYRCQAGMAIVHPRYHLHGNRFAGKPVSVTNVNLPFAARYQVLYLADRHYHAAMNTRDPKQLLTIVQTKGRAVSAEHCPRQVQAMARSLRSDPLQRIDELAQSVNLSPEHATRQFKRFAGMTPATYRAERRLRHALQDLGAGQCALDVAHRWGFSDQSHLCRTVKAATSRTITDLQTSELFNTQEAHR